MPKDSSGSTTGALSSVRKRQGRKLCGICTWTVDAQMLVAFRAFYRVGSARRTSARASVRTDNQFIEYCFARLQAGDWHPSFETVCPPLRPHLMRCMLTSNLAVENRFANGTQGRVLQWQPEKTEKKAFLASHPNRAIP